MAQLFRSERIFQVWHYTAAHRDRLLLRATRDQTDQRRIDLYVEGVRGVLLEPLYRGIVIRAGTPEEVREVESVYGIPVTSQPVHLHVIGEDRMRGFIVGGPLQRHEDEGDFRDPSHFGPIPGTP
ncbi:hypothetical protein [Streptomyces sp. NPDC002573]|uniref:hypothetical protein n=1 Tax=Streptomyces sp. NPDC002573 TaxID=3364651 RepID=UPI00367D47C8